MADYIYLLENRLSLAQRNALRIVRELARSKNLTVFLVGGAVRDLTSGSPVRDLDVVVQGNALKLKADLEKAGAVITGEIAAGQALFATFPGSVRVEIGSTLSVTWPKPGKPVYKPATLLDDLRRRDFTANAMALSLNEGSYGLLMDPLNGIADIENRELRLVSNYGFIEDPIRMVRAARLMARLGWSMDEKTQQRYDNGKAETYIAALGEQQRGYELEEIVHEEDPLRVMNRLESEGWLQILAPYWTAAKVDVAALEHLREVQTQLQMQGIHPDASAANFPLLTAKLNAKDVSTLKSSFIRQGFVAEIESLEHKGKELLALLTGKASTLPSQTWQILTSAAPEAVLWVAYSSKSAAIQAKFKSFFTVWPQARQKIPYTLLQEMRIVAELPIYEEVLTKLFFEFMDDKLQTPEEQKAFLEPFSPPAPPPPINMRRPRAAKKESKGKGRAKKVVAVDTDDERDSDDDSELPEEIDEVLTEALDETAVDLAGADAEDVDDASGAEAEEAEEPAAPVVPRGKKVASTATVKPPKRSAPAPEKSTPEKPVPAKAAKAVPAKAAEVRPIVTKPLPAKAEPAKAAKDTPAKAVGTKPAAKKAAVAEPSPAKVKAVVAKTAKRSAAVSSQRKTAPSGKVSKQQPPAKSLAKSKPKSAGGASTKPTNGTKPGSKSGTRTAAKPGPSGNAAARKPLASKKVAAKKVVAKKAVAAKSPPKKVPLKKVPVKKSIPQTAPVKKQASSPKSASKKSVIVKKRR